MSPEISRTTAGPFHVKRLGNTLHCVFPEPGGAIVTMDPSPEYVSGVPSGNDPIFSAKSLRLEYGVFSMVEDWSHEAEPEGVMASDSSFRTS